ncbi:MAG: PepSY domain-containing protein [Deltaproteobacteria bacterium]|nr:PepSY domain-containing protein [Deltaproteobacteria bacterium]
MTAQRPVLERLLRVSRKVHTWSGVALALLVLVEAVTAIFLLNKKALATIDKVAIDTRALPSHYARAPNEARAFEVLAVDPRDGARLWAGTKWGLEESVDGGATFTERADVGHVKSIHFDGDAIWTGGPGGLFRCDSDMRCARREGVTEVRSIASLAPGTLLVATKQGLFRSDDRGATFQPTAKAETNASVPLGKVLGDLHTGKFFDGKLDLAYDALGLALVVFVITGLHLWVTPILARRRKARAAPGARRVVAKPIGPVETEAS